MQTLNFENESEASGLAVDYVSQNLELVGAEGIEGLTPDQIAYLQDGIKKIEQTREKGIQQIQEDGGDLQALEDVNTMANDNIRRLREGVAQMAAEKPAVATAEAVSDFHPVNDPRDPLGQILRTQDSPNQEQHYNLLKDLSFKPISGGKPQVGDYIYTTIDSDDKAAQIAVDKKVFYPIKSISSDGTINFTSRYRTDGREKTLKYKPKGRAIDLFYSLVPESNDEDSILLKTAIRNNEIYVDLNYTTYDGRVPTGKINLRQLLYDQKIKK
jgi:hypothetical protein